MNSRFLTILGFACATISVVTWLHSHKVANIGDALDGLVSGIYFSAIFATGLIGGVWIFALRLGNKKKRMFPLLLGINAGLVSWIIIYLIWSLPFINRFPHITANAFVANSVFIYCIGVLLNKLALYKTMENES